MIRGSLTRRLIGLAAVWSVAVLVLTGVVLTAAFYRAALARFDEFLKDSTDALYAGASVRPDGSVAPPALTDARAQRAYSGRYWQIAEITIHGRVRPLVRSRSLWDSDLPPPPGGKAQLEATSGEPVFYDARGPNGEPLRAAAQLARLPERPLPVVFMAAADRSPVDEDAREFAVLTAAALVVLGAGLVSAVFLQVRFGLMPLFAMGREIADVRKGKTQRLQQSYPEELAPLAQELNALLDHNQEVVERQRTHVGNLAHALKTPLSVMVAEADRQKGPLGELVYRQASAMREHIDHHLRRARAAARAQSPGERTVVAPVLDELAVTLERIFQDKGVVIDWRAPDDLCFRGEKQDFLEMAGNVLENACKWAKGNVRAAALSTSSPERFKLVVEDDGPGVPPEKRDAMLARGERLDEQAPGSGLGLSIVEELARAYGGSVHLADAATGGLRVEIVLPRALD